MKVKITLAEEMTNVLSSGRQESAYHGEVVYKEENSSKPFPIHCGFVIICGGWLLMLHVKILEL